MSHKRVQKQEKKKAQVTYEKCKSSGKFHKLFLSKGKDNKVRLEGDEDEDDRR